MNHYWLALLVLCCLGGIAARPRCGETTSLLAAPESVKTNITASPKFDDRVFVYTVEPVSASVLEHKAGGKELSLNVGTRDGVRFGHAFQIADTTAKKWIGVAKVMELGANHCIAKLISLDREQAARSIEGFTAICTAPKSKANATIMECRFGKEVWQTESFEDKLIRGLIENCGKNGQIWIQQVNSVGAHDSAAELAD